MKKTLLFLFLIAVVSVLILWWFENSKQSIAPLVSAPDKETNVVLPPAKNMTASVAKPETNASDKIDTNSVAAKYKEYKAGKIDKAELAKAMISEGNAKNQDFYGKVIDQYGEPVVGADITGNLEFDYGFSAPPKREVYKTQTDSAGLFQFTGLRGWQLGVTVKKDGYKMGERGEGYQAPAGGKSSPTDRVILTMWKLRGPEPLNNSSIETRIPHDGTPVAFDIASGKQSPSGNFQVTLSQYPLEVAHGWDRFDWSVKIEIPNGGFLEEHDPYPYWAPADGYQQSFEFEESSNAVKWLGGLLKNFYVKTAQGQYGLLQLKVFPGRSPTGLEANFTINPTGSQNLEPK
jgi:hypothetical protein